MKTYTETVCDLIKERLESYEGSNTYICDLVDLLMERENADGTHFYSTKKTFEFLTQTNMIDIIGNFIKYYASNIGCHLNPFLNPEQTHVYLLYESAAQVLSNLPMLSKTNNKISLTPIKIRLLKKQIDNWAKYNEIEF